MTKQPNNNNRKSLNLNTPIKNLFLYFLIITVFFLSNVISISNIKDAKIVDNFISSKLDFLNPNSFFNSIILLMLLSVMILFIFRYMNRESEYSTLLFKVIPGFFITYGSSISALMLVACFYYISQGKFPSEFWQFFFMSIYSLLIFLLLSTIFSYLNEELDNYIQKK